MTQRGGGGGEGGEEGGGREGGNIEDGAIGYGVAQRGECSGKAATIVRVLEEDHMHSTWWSTGEGSMAAAGPRRS